MEDIKKEYTDCVAPSSVAEEITTKVKKLQQKLCLLKQDTVK